MVISEHVDRTGGEGTGDFHASYSQLSLVALIGGREAFNTRSTLGCSLTTTLIGTRLRRLKAREIVGDHRETPYSNEIRYFQGPHATWLWDLYQEMVVISYVTTKTGEFLRPRNGNGTDDR